jgi:parvulin-like peptidyl-prolyl isomerase
LQPELARAAFELQRDQLAPKPVHSRFGWYVIKLLQRTTVPAPSYEAVHDELHQQLKVQVLTEAVKQARSMRRANAGVLVILHAVGLPSALAILQRRDGIRRYARRV